MLKKSLYFLSSLALLVACSEPSKEEKIAQLQKEIQKTEVSLNKMKSELKALTGDAELKTSFDKLVTTTTPTKGTFATYIEMPGKVVSRQNILVGPEVNGNITALYVINGQVVQKGQIIAKIDDVLFKSNIEELESAISLAEDLFERQKNLWEQKVGSELQYLQAKNNLESLQKRMATAQNQLAKTIVRAPMSGVVDEVFLKLGEMSGMGAPICRIVNLQDIYVETEVSEKYVGKVKNGDKVEVLFPSLDRKVNASITAVTQIINPGNRTFKAEVRVSNSDGLLKPNLLSVVRIQDYINTNAILIPTRLIQMSSTGNYVLVNENNIVVKKWIKPGRSNDGMTEVLEGLTGNESIIDLGFRDVTEGDRIQVKSDL
jgi:RND family efflux transporter MFP subunit